MSGQDQSQDLVISDFISGVQESLIVNKDQLHWHLWHSTGFPRTPSLSLCPPERVTSMTVSESDGACQY